MFSAPVKTGPGVHAASYTMGTGSLSRRQSGRSVALAIHPHLAVRFKENSGVKPLLPPSGPSWPVLGLNLPLSLPLLLAVDSDTYLNETLGTQCSFPLQHCLSCLRRFLERL